jgi:hypothetical protein
LIGGTSIFSGKATVDRSCLGAHVIGMIGAGLVAMGLHIFLGFAMSNRSADLRASLRRGRRVGPATLRLRTRAIDRVAGARMFQSCDSLVVSPLRGGAEGDSAKRTQKPRKP